MVITWIFWGAAPGYIKIAPKGLFKAFQSDFCFSKSPVCSLLEYKKLLGVTVQKRLLENTRFLSPKFIPNRNNPFNPLILSIKGLSENFFYMRPYQNT
jgi:hypothetical protein